LGGIAAQIEDCKIAVLPPQLTLPPAGIVVQRDALLETPSSYVLVEAKRLRRASFGPQQLAREYLAVIRSAGTRDPVLLLILGSPPPFTVQGQGPKEVRQPSASRCHWSCRQPNDHESRMPWVACGSLLRGARHS